MFVLYRVRTCPGILESYGKLAYQIPGLEKLWKNVILVKCPGNVMEFILEGPENFEEVKTFLPDFSSWGENTE